MVNYRSLNNKLIDRISKAKSVKARLNIMNKIFSAYERKLSKNSNSFFKNKNQSAVDFNTYTINTIKNRITNNILNNKFDVKVLKQQLMKIVKLSRDFQKQKNKVLLDVKKANKDDDDTMYVYILTNPTKHNSISDHDPRCYANSIKAIFTKEEMLEISKELPRHNHCDCRFVKIIEPKNLMQGENI